MSIDYLTLNNLYNNRVLEYVPTELLEPMTALPQNPNIINTSMPPLYGNNPSCYLDYTDITPMYNNNMSATGLSNNVQGYNNYANNSMANQYGNYSYNNPLDLNQTSLNGENLGSKMKKNIFTTPNLLKGLLSLGLIIGTGVLLFKRGKKKIPKMTTNNSSNTNFWSKLKFWKKN